MAQAIKVRYVNDSGMLSAGSYTFYSDEQVEVGDRVIIRFHQSGQPQYGVVTYIDVPLTEIGFEGTIKTIAGKQL